MGKAKEAEKPFRISANLPPNEKKTFIVLCTVLETKRNERFSMSDVVRMALTELAKANSVA